MYRPFWSWLSVTLFLVAVSAVRADEAALPIPAAILPFEARGQVKEEAAQVADLLFVQLVASDELMLVEREQISKVFEELKLNASGVVKADEATQVGKLSGARLLVTGSVFRLNGDLYLVAKVIGTETGRLAGASIKGAANADLSELVEKLAVELRQVVSKKSATLLPKTVAEADWLADIKKQLKDKKLPSVTVSIAEHHVGQRTFDPAAQTETERLLTELGFPVIDSGSPNAATADVLIKGEALSEVATRRDDLVSVKCRVETKVVRRSDAKVVTSDAETSMSVGLGEQLAAKSGLATSARVLVGRFVPKLIAAE